MSVFPWRKSDSLPGLDLLCLLPAGVFCLDSILSCLWLPHLALVSLLLISYRPACLVPVPLPCRPRLQPASLGYCHPRRTELCWSVGCFWTLNLKSELLPVFLLLLKILFACFWIKVIANDSSCIVWTFGSRTQQIHWWIHQSISQDRRSETENMYVDEKDLTRQKTMQKPKKT